MSHNSNSAMKTNETSQGSKASLPSAPVTTFDVDAWCKRLGWRVTEARLAIIRATQTMEGYFDAEELVARAQEFDAGASRATVYRALPRLCAAGLLRKTDVGEGRTRFSRSSPGEVPSAEIYVEDCGLILRVPAPFLTWYATSITERAGLQLIGQRLQTFARCLHKRDGGDCEQCPQPVASKSAAA